MQNSSKGNNSWKNHRTRTRRWYAHPPSILNIPMKFQWNPTSSFREFAWTRTVPYIFMQNSSKGNNSWKNHRTRTCRWYAHPPLILNIPMKFHWNPTSSFREFAWTRAGRTHGRTDTRTHGRSGDYMLPRNSSGSIINSPPYPPPPPPPHTHTHTHTKFENPVIIVQDPFSTILDEVIIVLTFIISA